MNLEKCMNILKDFTNQNLTTKELSELGITKHFISKLMERGKLERIKRGTYTVKTLKNMKNRKSFFAIRDFCKSTDLGYYSQAYYNLMRAYNIKTDNKSDNVIRVGFTLLQEILEKGDILSSLNNLEDLTLENKPNSGYWNKFCESVVNKDYITAKENIELSVAAQMGEQGFVGEVTKAMCDLVNKVISIKEDRTKLQEYSEKINSLIMENKYEEAIQYGEESIEHISDESLKESLNSLIELIKTVIAFKEDKEKNLNNQKMAIYGNDKPSVLLALYLRDKNYLSALKYISNVCAKKTNFYNKVVEKLLLELKDLNNEHSKNIHNVSISDSNYHFKKFLKVFSIDNLDEAMQELSISLSYANDENKNYTFNQQLLNMLKKLIRMRDNGESLDDMNINYNLKDDPINNFNLAIQKGDYKKAIAFSHVVQLNNSVVFGIKKELLAEMSKLDRIIEKNKPSKISQEKIEEQKQLINKNDEQKKIAPTAEDPKKEYVDDIINDNLRKQVVDIDLNYDNIYDLIFNREYELAYALMIREKNRGELDPLCGVCIRLIRQLKKLEKGHAKISYHTEETGDILKDFYQALDNYDYEFAYRLTNTIPNQLSETSTNSREFEIYKLLLEDLKKLQEDVINAKEELEELEDKITDMSAKQELTREGVEKLIEMLKRKIELSVFLSLSIDLDESLLNIAETTILSLDGRLNDSDFDKVKCESSDYRELFIESINQGDYLTSQEIINHIDWLKLKRKYPFSFLRLSKKMLNMMISSLRIISDKTTSKDAIAKKVITEQTQAKIDELVQELLTDEYKLLTDEDKIIYHKLKFLRTVRPMIRKRHYEEVFQKAIELTVPFDHELDADILGNLALIKSNLDHQANDLYNKYLKSLESCSNEEAQRYLEEYKAFLLENYMEDNKVQNQKSLKPQE